MMDELNQMHGRKQSSARDMRLQNSAIPDSGGEVRENSVANRCFSLKNKGKKEAGTGL